MHMLMIKNPKLLRIILEWVLFISTYFLKSRNQIDWKILVVVLNKTLANNIHPLLSKGLKERIMKSELF